MRWRIDARSWALALACGLCAGLLYAPAVSGQFAWDDEEILLKDPRALDAWQDAARAFVEPGAIGAWSGYYRPVLVASYVADRRLFGLDPRSFHGTNVLLHALNTAGVWALVYAFVRCRACATFGAALFGFHPMQAQAVSLITGRNDLLLVLPFVAALLLHRLWTQSGGTSRSLLAALGVAYAVALWTKETSILLPLILVAAERLVYQAKGRLLLSRTLRLLPLAVVALAYLWARFAIFGSLLGGTASEAVPLALRPRLVVVTIGYYLAHVLVPRGFSVTPYRDAMLRVASAEFLVSALLCGALAASIVLAWRRRPLLAFGLVVFTATLLPVSGLVTTKLFILEHRTYLPMVGMAIVAAGALHGFEARRVVVAQGGAFLIAGILALLTRERIPIYRSSLSLWEAAVRQVPDAPYARYALGTTLLKEGRFAEAVPQLARAVEMRPVHASARRDLAFALERAGRHEESLRQLEILIQLSHALAAAGRYREAAAALEPALERWPQHPGLREALRQIPRGD